MRLYHLGDLDWRDSQLIYHALAYEGIEALVISYPQARGMCLGLHQHPKDELNLEYCQANDIGIFRREIGGGTVLIDEGQVFYNVILKRSRPEVPRIPEGFFRKYLSPVVGALSDLGVEAGYRPMCDLLVGGRKISGNGGGEVGECMVLTGNVLTDFDRETMAGALALPEGMRAEYLRSMGENLTSLTDLGSVTDRTEVADALVANFEEVIGPLEPAELDPALIERMKSLDARYSADDWLLQRGAKPVGREVKVREGVYLFSNRYQTDQGILEVNLETADNTIIKVWISGAEDAARLARLESGLAGWAYERKSVDSIIASFTGGEAVG